MRRGTALPELPGLLSQRQALGTHWVLLLPTKHKCSLSTAWLPELGSILVLGRPGRDVHGNSIPMRLGWGLLSGELLHCQFTTAPGWEALGKTEGPAGPYTVDFHLATVPPDKLAAELVQHGPALPPCSPQA